MNELEQVDRFFQGEMPETERRQFAEALKTNPELASAAAFYLQARQAARLEVLAEKRKQWEGQSPRPIAQRSWLGYAAGLAAVLLVVLGLWFWRMQEPSRRELADAYVSQELQTLGTAMSGRSDTLQQGIGLYNQGKLPQAAQLFDAWLVQHATDSDAQRLAGLTALRLKQYDQAINHFQQLSRRTDLYANPGPFYEALARIQRNRPEDAEAVQQLLKRVVQEGLPGKAEAVEWMK